jgi:hypothetical protein
LFRRWVVREDSRPRGKDPEQQQAGSKASDPWPYWSYVLSLCSSHIGLHALILLPKPRTLGIWIHSWLVMLSHAVMSVVQVFHHLWCWVGLCLCESVVVFHLLICELNVWESMLWFEQRLEWWRWLILSWHVVLKYANDQILGVDTPGQHVPPCVQYGTSCLLIINAIVCVSCSVEWGCASFFMSYMWHTLWYAWTTWCKRGRLCGKP